MEFLKQYLDLSVFAVLGFMSFLALAFTIERAISYSRIKVQRYPQLELLKLELNKGLPIIATIASNAPYVGLLGTVFGIMLTFHDIGQSGQIDTNSVMVGLSLALKATALGLLVAIPAMIFYNLLVAKSERLISYWKIAHGVKDHS
ncbi:UNVERIFIED_CONTAM: hypothetical protein GTU68_027109 [Idotea baltica]|nr:hypothetical protein [Idotea baltica]